MAALVPPREKFLSAPQSTILLQVHACFFSAPLSRMRSRHPPALLVHTHTKILEPRPNYIIKDNTHAFYNVVRPIATSCTIRGLRKYYNKRRKDITLFYELISSFDFDRYQTIYDQMQYFFQIAYYKLQYSNSLIFPLKIPLTSTKRPLPSFKYAFKSASVNVLYSL